MNKVFQIQESMLAFISQYEEQGGARDYPLSWERVHMASCARIGMRGRRAGDAGAQPAVSHLFQPAVFRLPLEAECCIAGQAGAN